MLSAIDLVSSALTRIGADAISSFDDASWEAEVATQIYAPARDALLSAHPWTFATGQGQLTRLTATPLADYTYAYQLPSGFLRAISVGAGTAGDNAVGRGTDYRIHEQRLHSDAEAVVMTYIFRPDETAWPPFFDAALIARLMAEFAIPITESTTRSEALHRLAEARFRSAKTADSQQTPPAAIEGFPLISAHGGTA